MLSRVRRPIASSSPSWFVLAALLSLPLGSLACSEQGAAAQQSAPVGIVTRQSTVTIENRSDGPLDNATLTVVAFGNKEYSRPLGTLNKAEIRDSKLTELTGADGSTFSVAFTRPKAVKLHAMDASGKPVDVEVPWK